MSATIRLYTDRDFDYVVSRWHETNLISYRYVALHQRHTLHDARRFFRDHVLPSCEVWVAENADAVVGLLALEVPWIRQLAVFPEHQRHGIATLLLRKACERSPLELRLYTFRRNERARAFYEAQGFAAVAFGISPPPESEPDVEYRWRA